MGLLDIFGKNRGKSVPLIDMVVDMRQRGMPDQVIVQNLQGQGAPMPEIQDAMMQADIKMRVGGPAPAVSAPPQLLPQASMAPQGFEYQGAATAGMMAPPLLAQQQMLPPQQMEPPQQMTMQGPMMGPPLQMMMGPPPTQAAQPQQIMGPPPGMMGPPMPSYPSPMPQLGISTEDLVEKIVSEKMENLERRLSDQERIHSDLMQQIQQVRGSLNELKGKYSQLQEDSVVKIEEYNKELEGVGSQIKAMQRVMQNIIPTFAENVRSLTEVVRELRGPPEAERPQQRQQQVRLQQPSRQAAVMAPTKSRMARPEEIEETAVGEPWQARVRKIAGPGGAGKGESGEEPSLF